MEFTNIIYKIRNEKEFFEFTSREDLKIIAEQNAGMKNDMNWDDVFQVLKMIAKMEAYNYDVEKVIDDKLFFGAEKLSINEIFNEYLENNLNLFKEVITSHEFISRIIKHYIAELLDETVAKEAENEYIYDIVE